MKKIKEMNHEEKKEYYRRKIKEWRTKNPEKNRILRKKYKSSPKGKEARLRYFKNYFIRLNPGQLSTLEEARRVYFRDRYKRNPEKYKQDKDYINNYLKNYLKDKENHRKYLIRQKDYQIRRILLDEQGYCSLCGSKENLEIHHKSYDENKNIIILCRSCHRKIHRKTKQTGGQNKWQMRQ